MITTTGANHLQAPALEGDALAAVLHRGSHLQIIAAAGSGKTEVVAQRVADLLADGVAPRGIVAFTFTERAAGELKARITARVQERLGDLAVDQLVGLFVGTIHAYCFGLLNQRVPRYATYDVLDDHQLTAFLSREAHRLGLKAFDPKGRSRLFAGIEAFVKSVDVVENELLKPASMPEPFRGALLAYHDTLERYRLLTFGQQGVRAVAELERPELAGEVHAELAHLIVDEYQDVNPAQERLVRLLCGPQTELCVVGDDDQAIYGWRGSDVANIVSFAQRYPNVATYQIATNRRSLPQVVGVANAFAATIGGRLDKTMAPSRVGGSAGPQVVSWCAPTEATEAGWVANLVLDLNEKGARFSEIAVLVRGRVAYPRLVEAFATFDIPVQPGGRTGLFDQPEAVALGKAICWLVEVEWRAAFEPGCKVTDEAMLGDLAEAFSLDAAAQRRLWRFMEEWRAAVPAESRVANLVGEFYDLLDVLGVARWDLSNALQLNRLGTLARFSALLVDYESVRQRARPDAAAPAEQVGGQDRGTWYYRNLAYHIVNYAAGAYEGFDGESVSNLDAVDLTTLHRAKGLEWPAVFIPSVTAGRFPPSQTGRPQDRLVPRDAFAAARYEGSDADERRLFYVGVTRARDWASVSHHQRVNTNAAHPSAYWSELSELELAPADIVVPELEHRGDATDEPIAVTYSELAQFLDCAMSYRLRTLVGFKPRLAAQLGYGRAVHHVLQAVALATRANGRVPDPAGLEAILDASFFLPTASKAVHRQLRQSARSLVARYLSEYVDDLYRVWETERPFELHLDGVVVTGRADVILDKEGGVPTALAILDYKTSTKGAGPEHDLQLQVYSDAGRREGLDVRGAYVHDLKAARRDPVDVGPAAIEAAEARVAEAAVALRSREYAPNPGPRCRACEVRTICPAARR